MATDTMERWTEATKRAAEAFNALGQACSDARLAWERLSPILAELERWHRFDTLYGPIIGGAVILGTLALAALAAYG